MSVASFQLTRVVSLFSLSFCLGAMVLVAQPAHGQLSQEHLNKVRQQRTKGITYAGVSSSAKSPTRHLRSTIIDPVTIENARARDAFKWWSTSTGIPLVMNWRALENAGIDPDTPINISLRNAPAKIVLSLMLQQLGENVELMYETTGYYIRILSKDQARKETTLRIYDVKDMIKTIPSFTNAPQFDLNAALSNTSSGGSSGGAATASTTLFTTDGDKEVVKTETERGEELAQTIREMIEPEIWQAFGGQHSSVKFFNGRLIVRAPRYVHAQIGIPTVTAGRKSSYVARYTSVPIRQKSSKIGGVAGVAKTSGVVAGVN